SSDLTVSRFVVAPHGAPCASGRGTLCTPIRWVNPAPRYANRASPCASLAGCRGTARAIASGDRARQVETHEQARGGDGGGDSAWRAQAGFAARPADRDLQPARQLLRAVEPLSAPGRADVRGRDHR